MFCSSGLSSDQRGELAVRSQTGKQGNHWFPRGTIIRVMGHPQCGPVVGLDGGRITDANRPRLYHLVRGPDGNPVELYKCSLPNARVVGLNKILRTNPPTRICTTGRLICWAAPGDSLGDHRHVKHSRRLRRVLGSQCLTSFQFVQRQQQLS